MKLTEPATTESKPPSLGKRPFFIGIAAISALGLLVLVLSARQLGITAEVLKHWLASTLAYLELHPFFLFAGLVLLPGLGFPLSPLLILAGAVFGELFGLFWASLITLLGVALNMAWTYWVACFPARAWAENLIRRFARRVPEIPATEHVRLTVIIRLTPGIPFPFQNYFLGLARIPFRIYLPLSIFIQAGYTIGFVVSGGAIFKGKVGLALVGLALLIVAVLVTKIVAKRLRPPRVKLESGGGR